MSKVVAWITVIENLIKLHTDDHIQVILLHSAPNLFVDQQFIHLKQKIKEGLDDQPKSL